MFLQGTLTEDKGYEAGSWAIENLGNLDTVQIMKKNVQEHLIYVLNTAKGLIPS